MEYVCCDLCGADDSTPFLTRTDRFSRATFHYVRCRRCGLIYLNPRPDATEILKYYPVNYEPYQPLYSKRGLEPWLKRRGWKMLVRFILKYQTNGRLLDIGCATGEFLKEIQARGFDAYGVEINNSAAAIAQRVYGLRVFVGPLAEFVASEGAFDVVTMWDVLEHLPSPRSSLQQIYRWLRDGGFLFFSIPNIHSLDARLFGAWWIGWDAPRHLYLFPTATIKRLLQNTGFDIVDMRTFLGGPGSFWLSCQFILHRVFGAKKFPLSGLSQIGRLLTFVLIWPYKEICYLFNLGPIVTVVARKVA